MILIVRHDIPGRKHNGVERKTASLSTSRSLGNFAWISVQAREPGSEALRVQMTAEPLELRIAASMVRQAPWGLGPGRTARR